MNAESVGEGQGFGIGSIWFLFVVRVVLTNHV